MPTAGTRRPQCLDEARAKVALCLDHSGSMRQAYARGQIQALAERVLALATQLDDDGAVDVFFFGTEAWYAGELLLSDYSGGVDRLRAGHRLGQTDYAGAVRAVLDHHDLQVGAPAAERLDAVTWASSTASRPGWHSRDSACPERAPDRDATVRERLVVQQQLPPVMQHG